MSGELQSIIGLIIGVFVLTAPDRMATTGAANLVPALLHPERIAVGNAPASSAHFAATKPDAGIVASFRL